MPIPFSTYNRISHLEPFYTYDCGDGKTYYTYHAEDNSLYRFTNRATGDTHEIAILNGQPYYHIFRPGSSTLLSITHQRYSELLNSLFPTGEQQERVWRNLRECVDGYLLLFSSLDATEFSSLAEEACKELIAISEDLYQPHRVELAITHLRYTYYDTNDKFLAKLKHIRDIVAAKLQAGN